MKLQLISFAFFALLLSVTSCSKDRIEFYVAYFTVNDQNVGTKGTHSADDVLTFDMKLSLTNPDDYAYGIQDFEFRYKVNGSQFYVIQSDNNMDVAEFTVKSEVYLSLLELPTDLNNELLSGDKIDFEIWARDNTNNELTRSYQVVIE
jgi:hypothetical protein